MDTLDKIDCKICGKPFSVITSSHLRQHSTTVHEYISTYGLPIMAESAILRKSQNISKAKKGKPANNKNKSMSCTQKQLLSDKAKLRPPTRTGAVLSSETRTKISTSLTGKAFTDEHRANLKHTIERRKLDGTYLPPIPKGHKISPEHREKATRTLFLISQDKRKLAYAAKREKLITSNLTFISEDGDFWQIECNKCNTVMRFHHQIFDECRRGNEVCISCFPRESGTSLEEKELLSYIKSIYDGEILENCNSVLPGFELDIYLPELKIAIEYNGLYWHSVNSANNRLPKHIDNKFRYGHKEGVSILTIFSDEWINKKEIVKSRLLSRLSTTLKPIHARKCTIQHISSELKNNFLNCYHIQGKDISRHRYGAFFNNELIAVMTFTKTNMVKGGDGSTVELNRFCIKSGIRVTGIAGKLFKAFIKEHKPSSIISFSDNRWGDGKLYQALGFSLVAQTPPTYYYTNDYKHRTHRSVFMKHKLTKSANYSPEKTEFDIMRLDGWDWIYDCGSTKWKWKKPD